MNSKSIATEKTKVFDGKLKLADTEISLQTARIFAAADVGGYWKGIMAEAGLVKAYNEWYNSLGIISKQQLGLDTQLVLRVEEGYLNSAKVRFTLAEELRYIEIEFLEGSGQNGNPKLYDISFTQRGINKLRELKKLHR